MTQQTSAGLDLIVLVADSNMRAGMQALLGRREILASGGPIKFQVVAHPHRDPGVRQTCHDFLRPFLRRASHALVMFDREGSGAEVQPRDEIEEEVQRRLDANGWSERSAVIVIEPELEAWIWADWQACRAALGFQPSSADLRSWLVGSGYLPRGCPQKPPRPKEAFEAMLRRLGRPRSSSLYGAIAEHACFESCRDPAFQRLRSTLESWFGLQLRSGSDSA